MLLHPPTPRPEGRPRLHGELPLHPPLHGRHQPPLQHGALPAARRDHVLVEKGEVARRHVGAVAAARLVAGFGPAGRVAEKADLGEGSKQWVWLALAVPAALWAWL